MELTQAHIPINHSLHGGFSTSHKDNKDNMMNQWDQILDTNTG